MCILYIKLSVSIKNLDTRTRAISTPLTYWKNYDLTINISFFIQLFFSIFISFHRLFPRSKNLISEHKKNKLTQPLQRMFSSIFSSITRFQFKINLMIHARRRNLQSSNFLQCLTGDRGIFVMTNRSSLPRAIGSGPWPML